TKMQRTRATDLRIMGSLLARDGVMLRPTLSREREMDPHRWRLDGQLALVTGGSAGIGRAIARELLGFGATVLIVARSGDALESARDELADEFPAGDIRAFIGNGVDEEQRREILDSVAGEGGGPTNMLNNDGRKLAGAAN